MTEVDKYLKQTGQSLKYLYSGAGQYSINMINDLAKEALRENKKIVWVPDPDKPPELGLMLYRFQDF